MSHIGDGTRFSILIAAGLIAVMIAAALPGSALGASRIKDIVDFQGVRDNQLVGYGLVVGLNNTGDNLQDGSFTKQSLQSMLNRLGVKPTDKGLQSKNVAAVMVTATLPPYSESGDKLDVNVTSIGDSRSLVGGTLVLTPLAMVGETYVKDEEARKMCQEILEEANAE